MHFNFETFSVIHGVLVATGYSEFGIPYVCYDGKQVTVAAIATKRPDLINAFGQKAASWGFRLTALLPDIRVEHAKISISFADGLNIDFPGAIMQGKSDSDYGLIVERFKAEAKHGGRLLEIGSRARSGNTYRDWFGDNIDYTGIDIIEGPNVDVVGDAHHLSRYVSGKFDFVFSISVFEHILMPWKVALEMSRVMNLGGIGFIQSHSCFPLHEEPWDFWRFSKDAWKGIFNVHTGFEVISAGYAFRTWTVPTYACGSSAENMDLCPNYLISGCLIRKISEAKVQWDADAAEVYNLLYSHA